MSLTARAAYRQTALETAPKSRLLVQLYERMERDLDAASDAISRRDFEEANRQLLHAQDIVGALASSLDTAAWEGGDGLAQIYDFLLNELMLANLEKSIPRIEAMTRLIQDLAEAWRSVAGMASS